MVERNMCNLSLFLLFLAAAALHRRGACVAAPSLLFALSRAGSALCLGPSASTPIAARPSLVMHSASEPSPSSRRHSGSVPPEAEPSSQELGCHCLGSRSLEVELDCTLRVLCGR
jgi:hypothetical protein